ncbi:MAG: paraquat-inducible protein A [Cyclobacteriaceae bacterium]
MNLRNIVAFVLTIISLGLLYPGLTVPILQISIAPELPLLGKTTFYEQTQSILQTVETLYDTKNELVAFLILLFSVIVPVTKGVVILAVLMIKESKTKHRLYQLVYAIGKWSMADVFVVGIFIAFLSTQSNTAIDAVLLPGFNYFVAYCIISLLGIQLVKLD